MKCTIVAACRKSSQLHGRAECAGQYLLLLLTCILSQVATQNWPGLSAIRLSRAARALGISKEYLIVPLASSAGRTYMQRLFENVRESVR